MKDVHDIGLKGRLLLFLQNFLTDREFKVKVGSTLSELNNEEQGKTVCMHFCQLRKAHGDPVLT